MYSFAHINSSKNSSLNKYIQSDEIINVFDQQNIEIS
jgi:hypothetical protein